MTEPIFFPAANAMSVAQIATLTGAEPAPGCDVDRQVTGIAPLDLAGPYDLVFLDKPKLADALGRSSARVCLTTPQLAAAAPSAMSVLRTGDPYRAFVTVAAALFPDALRPSTMYAAPGRTDGAFVHPEARLEDGVTVDPGVVVGPGAEIGSGTVLAAGAVIGPQVRIGRNCAVGAGATVTHALIGDRVVLHPGVRIGQDGYGYLPGRAHRKVPQVGRVIVQDDVEIGANTTIDRGGVRDTVIGEGTKIDNLVQIGHNVRIGRHCILVAQVGVAGSCVIGDYAMLGGQVGLADHAEVGEGAQVAAQSGVMDSVPAGERWGGSPAMPLKDFFRATLGFRSLAKRDDARRARPAAGKDGEGA